MTLNAQASVKKFVQLNVYDKLKIESRKNSIRYQKKNFFSIIIQSMTNLFLKFRNDYRPISTIPDPLHLADFEWQKFRVSKFMPL